MDGGRWITRTMNKESQSHMLIAIHVSIRLWKSIHFPLLYKNVSRIRKGKIIQREWWK